MSVKIAKLIEQLAARPQKETCAGVVNLMDRLKADAPDEVTRRLADEMATLASDLCFHLGGTLDLIESRDSYITVEVGN